MDFSNEEYERLAEFFKLFGDGTRLQILRALDGKELCGGDIALELKMTQSAVSHQLKSLKTANLVKSRREGQNIYYSLADSHIEEILKTGLAHVREGKER